MQATGPNLPNPGSPFGPALNLSIWIDYDTIGRFVPPSFIGISREYTNESVFWDRNLDAWGAILDVLGPSPDNRIGGATPAGLPRPPTAEYLRSLATLHCTLGVRYIIGLPLFQNSPALALTIKQAFDKAFENFPRAILSYELGNEVGGVGGWGLGAGAGAGLDLGRGGGSTHTLWGLPFADQAHPRPCRAPASPWLL